jgi:hypothetical protein
LKIQRRHESLTISRFLWVAFQLDDICKEINDEGIRAALRSLPRGLNETYATILRRIVDNQKPDIAVEIFRWVAAAKRPLALDEISEIVAMELGDTHLHQVSNRMPTDLYKMIQNCSNLVIVKDIGKDGV